jgi:muconolactone delta-isomerase
MVARSLRIDRLTGVSVELLPECREFPRTALPLTQEAFTMEYLVVMTTDGDELERVLASMPLRVWRTDEVTPLARHPNDPVLEAHPDGTEFLTTFSIAIPAGTPAQTVADAKAREAERAYELAGQGHLLRLWALPGDGRSLGLWRVGDAAEMQAILKSLPLDAWMTVQTTPLSRHPGDPPTAGTRPTP